MSEHERTLRVMVFVTVFMPVFLLISFFYYLALGVRFFYVHMLLHPSVDLVRWWGKWAVGFFHGGEDDLDRAEANAERLARTLECKHPWLKKRDDDLSAEAARLLESLAEDDDEDDDGACVHELLLERAEAVLDALPCCQAATMPPCQKKATCVTYAGEGRCDAHKPESATDFPWAMELREYEREDSNGEEE